MRDIVNVHLTADLPIRTRALSYADRVEIRFGNAFPVVLVVDRLVLDRLEDAIRAGRAELEAAESRHHEAGGSA